jgi:uncharacterized protein (TIGR00288 family)
MTTLADARNLALFCDFENIALGVREARYPELNVKLVIERLLLKGSIVVRKAYCDWDRYKDFKAGMHLAGFELIEIPHVKQSGKNSADIHMVVDALDLCYTKPHVDTFVIMSGDSDFSPLVAKLRENNKSVIGVGVKNSTSNLLIESCDEFIYYDDLVREVKARPAARRATRGKRPTRGASSNSAADSAAADSAAADSASAVATSSEAAGSKTARDSMSADARADEKQQEAFDLVLATLEGLSAERGDDGKVWSSHVKQILKRRRPGFNESYYGFKSFNALLEEAAKRGLITLEREGKSGSYIVRAAAE